MKSGDKLLGDTSGPTSDRQDPPGGGVSLSQWREAIYARIVDKVGTRTCGPMPDIAAMLTTRNSRLAGGADATAAAAFEQFLAGLRDNLTTRSPR